MKYSFAIIGCGRIAKRHAEIIQKTGKLVAVCDINYERADELAKAHQAKSYYSIDDLLVQEPEVDIVVICSPNGLHAEHAIKSLQFGKHVLCEKPLCITSAAARQMVDTAYLCCKKLYVVKQNRYNEPVQLAKKAVDEGKIGRILSFQVNCFWNRPESYYVTGDWKGTKYLDGGILYTQFSHFIDLIYWFLGDTESISGFVTKNDRENIEIEDTGVASLKMKNGAIGTINYTINSYNHNLEGSFALFGENGSIKIGGQYLNTLEWYETANKEKPALTQKNEPNNYGFYQGSMSNHEKVYQDLVLSLAGDGTLLEAKDAVKTIEIIEAIYKASLQQ
ncbi:MAG TPA: Gfo/Idh/MocA family oxidoreductase [Flavisolibacter sp.]|nr:Gfo/Idh/MocA family oxidoreductase [Flavisolibacter sp.]